MSGPDLASRARPEAPPDLRLDVPVVVRVPASSANLGPGYDAVGLALGLHDEVEVTASTSTATTVSVSGEGERSVPDGEEHLVVRTIRHVLSRAGVREQPGLRLRCSNEVPHGRGLGSSATAIVTGVVAAQALLAHEVGGAEAVHLASALEGHPDNAAASVLGGMTVGWKGDGGLWRAVRVEPHPDLEPVVCVPDAELPTARARAMLPERVPHGDAAFTAGRAALLVEAMTRSPHLLLDATHDRLHQDHREPAMPATLALVRSLRRAGLAAVVSGAGPSVLVLTTRDRAAQVEAGPGWRVLTPGIDTGGARAATRGRRSEDAGSPARPSVLQ